MAPNQCLLQVLRAGAALPLGIHSSPARQHRNHVYAMVIAHLILGRYMKYVDKY
jgi:hypothetical protein